MQGYKVYITGESYAGAYCPYIASAMLDEADTTYFDMSGMLIYDPVIAPGNVQDSIPVVSFVDYWGGLFPFNDTFRASIHATDKSCGYTDWVNKYLVYPPKGKIPDPLPGLDASGRSRRECRRLFNDVFSAILELNPCFDIYQVATTCPILWDVMGFPGSFNYLPDGAQIYFDRADVKPAINAPANVTWEQCSSDSVFVGGDSSDPSSFHALPHVIEKTNNVIIGHGALDMVLIANGTLLGIQNMTWNNHTGFQTRPDEPFYVPYHNEYGLSTVAGAGVFGTAHTERGLTYVGVDLSGHMIPQYAPSAAYRHLEFLLGRVGSLNAVVPFTTDKGVPQSVQPLGLGTAPQGWSDARSCKMRRSEARPMRG
jgi:carboxypeptidase D